MYLLETIKMWKNCVIIWNVLKYNLCSNSSRYFIPNIAANFDRQNLNQSFFIVIILFYFWKKSVIQSNFLQRYVTKIRKLEKCQKKFMFEYNSWSLHSVDHYKLLISHKIETCVSPHIFIRFFISCSFWDISCQKPLQLSWAGLRAVWMLSRLPIYDCQ